MDIPDGKKGVDWNDVLILKGQKLFLANLKKIF
jgi:hypothetical protein